MPPRVKPFAFSAIELINKGEEFSKVKVDKSVPALDIFQIVAIVKSPRVGIFGSIGMLSGLTGDGEGTALGITTGAFALDPATQIFPEVSAAIAVAILEAPCVNEIRHFSAPFESSARILDSLSKTIDEPTTNIFVSALMGVARLRAAIDLTTIGFGAAEALWEIKRIGKVKSKPTKRFTILTTQVPASDHAQLSSLSKLFQPNQIHLVSPAQLQLFRLDLSHFREAMLQ